jgi:hypothetical protein
MSKKKSKSILDRPGNQIFSVWYRAANKDTNEVLAESSNLKEIVRLTKDSGVKVRYLKMVTLKTTLPWAEIKKKDIPEVEPLE